MQCKPFTLESLRGKGRAMYIRLRTRGSPVGVVQVLTLGSLVAQPLSNGSGGRVAPTTPPEGRYEVRQYRSSILSTKEWGSKLGTEGKSAVPRLPLLGASASTGMLVGKVMPEKYSDADNGKGGRGWF